MKKETFEKLKRWRLIRKGLSWDDFQKIKSDFKEGIRESKEEYRKKMEVKKQNRPEELRKMGRMLAICSILLFFMGLLFPPLWILAFLCLMGLLVTVAMKYLEE